MPLYSSIDTVTTWKKSTFILSEGSAFNMINNLSIVVHAFARHMLTSISADEILLPWNVNWSTNFSDLPLKGEMAPYCLKSLFCLYSCRGQCFLLLLSKPMQQKFSMGRCICKKCYTICKACICNSFGGISSASNLFLW